MFYMTFLAEGGAEVWVVCSMPKVPLKSRCRTMTDIVVDDLEIS